MKLINKICSFFTIPFVFSYMSSNDTNLSIKTEANYMKSFEDNQNHEEPMNLCFATDDKYAVHTATAIASILVNSKSNENFRIFILYIKGKLSDETKNKLSKLKNIKNFELLFKEIDTTVISKLKVKNKHLNLSAWDRLFMLDLCREAQGKILYLDGDIIVRKSLRELYDTDISNFYVAAISDYYIAHDLDCLKSTWEIMIDLKKYEKIPDYFNSGVMLINIPKCLEEKVFEKTIEFGLNNSEKILHEDQDSLNFTCLGHVKFLDLKFNCIIKKRYHYLKSFTKEEEKHVIETMEDPVIVHFVGSKPLSISSKHFFRNEYMKYLALTEWKNENNFLKDIAYYIQKSIFSVYWKIIECFLIITR